jgi:UDPglucose 6-dehydrogenase
LSELVGAQRICTVANPEFLRESYAVYDFCHPERVVIGSADEEHGAADRVAELYAGDTDHILHMSVESAELAKYASNAFLAVKLSFVNSVAELCGRVGANISDVTACMAGDERIGRHFLAPGPGWGGSCLPKDTAALLHTGRVNGIELREVQSAQQTNSAQVARIIATLRQVLHRQLDEVKVTALGLTFKAGTSDIRDSPAIAICAGLQRAGAQVTAYDPRLDSIDTAQLPVATAADPYVAAKDADAIVVLTEWAEFSKLDWDTVARCATSGAVVIDSRNILDGNALDTLDLVCLGNGTARSY